MAPMLGSQAQGGALEKELARVKATGATGTAEGGKASEKFMQDLTSLKNAAMGIVQVVQEQLTPKVDAIVVKFTALIGQNKEAISASIVKFITDFSAGLVKLIADLDTFLKSQGWKDFKSDVGTFASTADRAAEAVGGWGKAIEYLAEIWMGAKVLAMITRMGTVLELITGLARFIPIITNPFVAIPLLAAGGLYAEFKNRTMEAQAAELKFQPSDRMFTTDEQGHPTEYKRDGKYYDVFEVRDEIAKRGEELKAIDAKIEATNKAQQDAADAQKDAAEAQKKAADAMDAQRLADEEKKLQQVAPRSSGNARSTS